MACCTCILNWVCYLPLKSRFLKDLTGENGKTLMILEEGYDDDHDDDGVDDDIS